MSSHIVRARDRVSSTRSRMSVAHINLVHRDLISNGLMTGSVRLYEQSWTVPAKSAKEDVAVVIPVQKTLITRVTDYISDAIDSFFDNVRKLLSSGADYDH
jgi:hypothetical protein